MTESQELCDAYATWDGAYVLGALARDERREYEDHLVGCDRCKSAVTELAGLPGLLALVDEETAVSVAAQEDPPSTVPPPPDRLLPKLAEAADRKRRRGRWLALGGAVAAVAAAVAVAIPVTADIVSHRPPAQEVVAEGSFQANVDTTIVATFKVLAVDGQTRVDMWCSYPPSNSIYAWQLSLWVVRQDGTQSKLAEWTAKPGEVYTPDGTTSAAPGDLKTVEVRNASGNVLLSAGL
ncbi:zf-HC2 domain-containing protein [Nocardia huaxiensis]|uniref:Zf-HC2 domain-containing protein n=1 Tax=Nocardia huaxiensis TaxID=2755382 RepID=A0A7D6VB75_9NOCA|nr:zf-HC2 domain-containing protein [Nocardia huaxiensis]QLY30911.1 zf-HC2 domain-containing protein [Nocardia huaxiensis]UFS94421.1 zf-HC2 domain-containing protein [Nocardia huaxiensis]